jgi:pimeloyl-ACP methyl ester carboxylesterase
MYVSSNGVRIHVSDRGAGGLPLVFLHYWGGSSRTWDQVIERLPEPQRTIAIDHRGWGLSDAPASGYALKDLASDAQAVIEALDLQAFILVGHSMGGKVATLMASRRLMGLVGLVLVAPSPPTPLEMPPEAREQMASAYMTRDTVMGAVEHVLTSKPLSARVLEQVIEDSLRGSPKAKEAWPRATSLENISEDALKVDVPTIVISGELDRVDPVAVLRKELLTRIPSAVLHVIPETGHLAMLESPDAVAALIGKFARDVQDNRSAHAGR